MRRSREDWKALVAEYRGGGSSADEFSRRRGLKVATLRWWCSELRDEVMSRALVPVRFVPLRPVAGSASTSKVVEARVGAVALRFEAGTDVDYVASLLGRLGTGC